MMMDLDDPRTEHELRQPPHPAAPLIAACCGIFGWWWLVIAVVLFLLPSPEKAYTAAPSARL
jgi:hypothetical protein